MSGRNAVSEQEIDKIVIKIGESKPNLRVQGLEGIHPIYEALIALFKRNLSDNSLAIRFAKDPESLRSSIAADTLLDRVKQLNKSEIIKSFENGASLDLLIDNAAVSIAENKRTKDGKVLYCVQGEKDKKYFTEALTKIDPRNIYVSQEEVSNLRKRAKSIRTKTIIYRSIVAGIAILTASYYGYQGYKIYKTVRDKNKIEESTKNR